MVQKNEQNADEKKSQRSLQPSYAVTWQQKISRCPLDLFLQNCEKNICQRDVTE